MSAPRTLSEARWSCAGCGQCCHGFDFGPVADAVISGLEEASIADSWAPAAEAPWRERRRGPDGSDAWYLTHAGVTYTVQNFVDVWSRKSAQYVIESTKAADVLKAFKKERSL